MGDSSKFIIIYTTFPDKKSAETAINGLVVNKIIACGNIFKISSIYAWQGKIEKAFEHAAIIKTVQDNYQQVEEYILKNHPYEVPEIISWSIEKGSPAFLEWIEKESNGVSV